MLYKKSQFSNISSFRRLRSSLQGVLGRFGRRSPESPPQVDGLLSGGMSEFDHSLRRISGRFLWPFHQNASEGDDGGNLGRDDFNRYIKQYLDSMAGPGVPRGRRRPPSRGQEMADLAQLIRRAMERNL